eukprot:TRINITY_DN184_c0_g1_i3.p1 TRINITY_DN184_c0_g1~~TRINITY_DN184_c0_g1_i3.p1  ORF type:complete len:412 (+),score=78.23 TRINITY_DN184_c0_g1_i3:416-1651(+)
MKSIASFRPKFLKGGTSGGTGKGSQIKGKEPLTSSSSPSVINSSEGYYIDPSFHCYVDPQTFVLDEKNPPVVVPTPGFRTELGGKVDSEIIVQLEDEEKNSLYYKEYFYSKEHINYIGGDEAEPVIVSISEEKDGIFKTITRTKKDDYIITIPASLAKGKPLKCLKDKIPEVLSEVKLKEVKDQNFCTKLLHMEDRLLIKSYKFGVIYCRAGQTDENDMFSNDEGSPEFEEFLQLLGQKIELKGWKGFRGGLDVDNNTTGSHSWWTDFHGFEIMFHVSTLLPFSTENRQQLERKRHIGNDVVAIVFQDAATPFSPKILTSKFNHVYAVVAVDHKDPNTGQTFYKFCIASKEGVRSHGPVLPAPPIFERGPEFRDYLITKLINAERAAYYAPGFAVSRTRRLWFKELLELYG